MLSTFGLISAGKGIELADLARCPAVVAAHPEVLYLIAGQTHPEVVKPRARAIGWAWSGWSASSA